MPQAPVSHLYSRALVTGASSGLGRAISECLLAEGVAVCGTARNAAALASSFASAVAAGNFHALELELSDEASVASLFERADSASGGPFDLLVLCAGAGVFGPFTQVSEAHWEAQLEQLLVANVRLAREACLRLQKSTTPSCLVFVGSLASELPIPYMAGYNMAKAAVAALAETLVMEYSAGLLSVIELRPGDYQSGFHTALTIPLEPRSGRVNRVYHAIAQAYEGAPTPEGAAASLRKALLARRRGVVRCGSFFQTCLASFAAAVLPQSLMRTLRSYYFRDRS